MTPAERVAVEAGRALLVECVTAYRGRDERSLNYAACTADRVVLEAALGVGVGMLATALEQLSALLGADPDLVIRHIAVQPLDDPG